jgi:heme exporter protein A
MSLFSGTDLTCVRGERTVFSGLAFGMDAGGMLLLVGPNGSGKSSLLRLMAGLLHPTHGVIRWQNTDTLDDPETHNGRLHYVGHHDALKPVLTVTENLRFWVEMHGGSAGVNSRISQALEGFGIPHLSDVPARYLSAGQGRRTSLARILSSPAPLWLLDEPTTALDKDAVAALEAAITEHRSAGGMVVISTHTSINGDCVETLDLTPFAQAAHKFDDGSAAV